MNIGDGATAMSTWNKLVNKKDGEKKKTRNDLLRYCELDTLAMVKVLKSWDDYRNIEVPEWLDYVDIFV